MKKVKSFDLIKGDHGLCHRCEHRIKWLETGMHRPRCECGDVNAVKGADGNWYVHSSAKHSCYMYEPVKPLVMEVDKGECRSPFLPWMLSGRSHAVGLPTTLKHVAQVGKKFLIYHVPCTNKQIKQRREENNEKERRR